MDTRAHTTMSILFKNGENKDISCRSQLDQHKTAILLVYDKKQVIVETELNLAYKIKAHLTYQTELVYPNTII